MQNLYIYIHLPNMETDPESEFAEDFARRERPKEWVALSRRVIFVCQQWVDQDSHM